MVRVSVVVPALNEAANLPHVLLRTPRLPEIVEVILVNGASNDGTPDVARALLPSIRIVDQDGRGKGNAVRCGALAAEGDYFLVMDADGSHRPEEIPLYIEMARQGYEMIKGCRYLQGGGTDDETLDRGIMVRLVDIVANMLWGTDFTDMAYGMFMIDRQKFLGLDLTADHFDIEWEVLIKAKRAGLRIARVPAHEASRIHGRSHLTYRRDGWLIFKTVMREGFRGLRERAVNGRRSMDVTGALRRPRSP
jgi:glycosyltransferase involved in cell wall biosynthesis